MNSIRVGLMLLTMAFSAVPLRALDSVASLPEAATSFGAVVSGGELFLYGGHTGERHVYTADKVSGAFHRIALKDGATWEALPRGLAAQGTALVAVDGRLYRVGGMAARNLTGETANLQSLDSAAEYDPATRNWNELPALPAARSSHDVAVIGHTLYAGGGWRLSGSPTAGVYHTHLAALDLSAANRAWTSIPQPFARRGLALVAAGGRLYFIGGMTGSNEPTLAVDIYDPKSGAWTSGPELPKGKLKGFGNSAVTVGDRIYVSGLGGDIHALSPGATNWEVVARLQRPRFFHRLLAADDQTLLALGGEDEEGKIANVEVIHLGRGTSADPATPAPRAATGTPSSTLSGWPQWRGPNRDGRSTETGWRKDWAAEAPRQLWKARVGVGMSSPVVASGRAILCGNDGQDTDRIVALDVLTGAILWEFTAPGATKVHEMPIVPPGPGATPTVAGDHVFALSRDGILHVLDLRSGVEVWKKNLVADLGGKRPVYGYTQSPLVADGVVFLDIGGAPEATGSTVALDAATGAERWRGGSGEAGYSSARMHTGDGRRSLVMFKGEALTVLDPENGRLMGSYATTSRDYCNSLTPVFVENRILVSNTGASPAALLGWEGGALKPAWTNGAFALLFNNALLHEGCLFGFNEQRRGVNEFTCLDATTGATRWVSDTVDLGVFVLSDGQWIFFTRKGEVVLAPASRESLVPAAKFQAVGGKCYATPALAGGVLVVRNNDGDTAAYDLRPHGGATAGTP
ncbi:MAG: PQQ-binding-like beta-propeller repeat protein [Verrucomicrobiales bacterium]|nr:PQQ-binding-like beta-propeller repeat protein [Verrucomicrobiales bacterium]